MKEIVAYVYGSFNDYLGKEHKIVVCGVTTPVKDDDVSVLTYDEHDFEEYNEVQKILTIGVSICNPIDEYDQEKGEMIAYGKAKNLDTAIMLTSSRRGMFNTSTVNFILNDYLSYIERDPGSILKGYDKAMAAHIEKIDILDDIKKLKEDELSFIKRVATITPEQLDYARKVSKLLKESD